MDQIHAMEAILFASGDPVTIDKLAEVLGLDREDVIDCGEHLSREYQKRKAGWRTAISFAPSRNTRI